VILAIIGIAAHTANQLINDHTVEAGLTSILSVKETDAATRTFAEAELRAIESSNAQIMNGLLAFIATILTAFFGIFGVGYAARTGFMNMSGQNLALQSQWSNAVAQNAQVNSQMAQARSLLDGLETKDDTNAQKLSQARGLLGDPTAKGAVRNE